MLGMETDLALLQYKPKPSPAACMITFCLAKICLLRWSDYDRRIGSSRLDAADSRTVCCGSRCRTGASTCGTARPAAECSAAPKQRESASRAQSNCPQFYPKQTNHY